MKAPILNNGNYSLLISNYAFGQVCKKDLSLFEEGDLESEVFQIFEDLNAIEKFVSEFIKNNPDFECSLYDHNGQYIKTIDKNG